MKQPIALRLAVVGAGRMAEAMVGGMIERGHQRAIDTHVYDVHRSRCVGRPTAHRTHTHTHTHNKHKLRTCAHTHDKSAFRRMDLYSKKWPGIGTCTSATACVEGSDVVLLAVKPQHMPGVLSTISPALPSSALAVSIAAGCPISMFTKSLPTKSVVRSMPNTPALVGKGMSVWTATEECTEAQRQAARRLFSCFGEEHYVSEEQQLDIATALVGSGPAYALLLMEAMIDAGVHMGFPREVSERLVLETVSGSVEYLKIARQTAGANINTLRNDITSPGGTTAAAIYTAEKGGLRTVVADTVWAAYRRSLELGGADSNIGPGRSKRT